VAIAVNDKGALAAYPEVEVIGLPETDAAGTPLGEIARRAVDETFETLPKPRRRDPDELAESLRRAVRAAIAERWGKKPICHVHVLVV
jgi:ribonuclease J